MTRLPRLRRSHQHLRESVHVQFGVWTWKSFQAEQLKTDERKRGKAKKDEFVSMIQ